MNSSLMLMQQLVQDRSALYQAKADKARRGKLLRRASVASAATTVTAATAAQYALAA